MNASWQGTFLLELLSKGFALIKANSPSFAILKSELLFGRLPLYKPSIHILLYISISCTSINLHRSWEDKIFTIKKSGCKKHLSKCSLQSLYPKNAPPKNFPTKKIGRIEDPHLPRPLSVVPFPSSLAFAGSAAEGNHPPAPAPRWPPRPQTKIGG